MKTFDKLLLKGMLLVLSFVLGATFIAINSKIDFFAAVWTLSYWLGALSPFLTILYFSTWLTTREGRFETMISR